MKDIIITFSAKSSNYYFNKSDSYVQNIYKL